MFFTKKPFVEQPIHKDAKSIKLVTEAKFFLFQIVVFKHKTTVQKSLSAPLNIMGYKL
jgi:hypothetical protein